MKRIGEEFRLLMPGAEKALMPLWLAVADRIKERRSNCDTVLWTTDSLGGFLTVRLIDSANEDASHQNDFLYSTPHIGQASKVLSKILGERFCDETVRPFQIVYEIWIDHLLRVSLASPKVQSAFRSLIAEKPCFQILATSIDEGLRSQSRIIWTKRTMAKKVAASDLAGKKRPTEKKKVAVLKLETTNRKPRQAKS